MDEEFEAWCPVCDRQILPKYVPLEPLTSTRADLANPAFTTLTKQPTLSEPRPEKPSPSSSSPPPPPLPPTIVAHKAAKVNRSKVTRTRTANGRIQKRISPGQKAALKHAIAGNNNVSKVEKPKRHKASQNQAPDELLQPEAVSLSPSSGSPPKPQKRLEMKAVPRANPKALPPVMVLEEGPLPLYCSEECRMIDEAGGRNYVDEPKPSVSDGSSNGRSPYQPQTSKPTPQFSRITSLPALTPYHASHHSASFTQIYQYNGHQTNEEEARVAQMREAFKKDQEYRKRPWEHPEYQASIDTRKVTRALEVDDVVHAPGRFSRPSSFMRTASFGPDGEAQITLGGENGYRNWYYGEGVKSLPGSYGQRRNSSIIQLDKAKHNNELVFTRQPSSTNITSVPTPHNGPSRNNSRAPSRNASRNHFRKGSGRGVIYPVEIPLWVRHDEADDYLAWQAALERQSEKKQNGSDGSSSGDNKTPPVPNFEEFIKMRKSRKRPMRKDSGNSESQQESEHRRPSLVGQRGSSSGSDIRGHGHHPLLKTGSARSISREKQNRRTSWQDQIVEEPADEDGTSTPAGGDTLTISRRGPSQKRAKANITKLRTSGLGALTLANPGMASPPPPVSGTKTPRSPLGTQLVVSLQEEDENEATIRMEQDSSSDVAKIQHVPSSSEASRPPAIRRRSTTSFSKRSGKGLGGISALRPLEPIVLPVAVKPKQGGEDGDSSGSDKSNTIFSSLSSKNTHFKTLRTPETPVDTPFQLPPPTSKPGGAVAALAQEPIIKSPISPTLNSANAASILRSYATQFVSTPRSPTCPSATVSNNAARRFSWNLFGGGSVNGNIEGALKWPTVAGVKNGDTDPIVENTPTVDTARTRKTSVWSLFGGK